MSSRAHSRQVSPRQQPYPHIAHDDREFLRQYLNPELFMRLYKKSAADPAAYGPNSSRRRAADHNNYVRAKYLRAKMKHFLRDHSPGHTNPYSDDSDMGPRVSGTKVFYPPGMSPRSHHGSHAPRSHYGLPSPGRSLSPRMGHHSHYVAGIDSSDSDDGSHDKHRHHDNRDMVKDVLALRHRIFRMYQHYVPTRLDAGVARMKRYVGREMILLAKLVNIYGPEPPPINHRGASVAMSSLPSAFATPRYYDDPIRGRGRYLSYPASHHTPTPTPEPEPEPEPEFQPDQLYMSYIAFQKTHALRFFWFHSSRHEKWDKNSCLWGYPLWIGATIFGILVAVGLAFVGSI